jgi:hypothetical protein
MAEDVFEVGGRIAVLRQLTEYTPVSVAVTILPFESGAKSLGQACGVGDQGSIVAPFLDSDGGCAPGPQQNRHGDFV